MAHLSKIERPKCHYPGCTKNATVMLVSNRNSQCGCFCAQHGNWRCKERKRIEAGEAPYPPPPPVVPFQSRSDFQKAKDEHDGNTYDTPDEKAGLK